MRVMGIDPSSEGNTAFCILDTTPRVAMVSLGILTYGGECEELSALIRERRVEALAIEKATTVYGDADDRPEDKRRAARMGITAALLAENLLAGMLCREAELRLADPSCSLKQVALITWPEWKKRLGIKVPRRSKIPGAKRVTKNAVVARVIRMRVAGWPARSNDHERDAAGVALGAFGGTGKGAGG